MQQFEKVCKGLETHLSKEGECEQCPYRYSPGSCAMDRLHRDALTLIRQQQERIRELEAAQTPRVMTLEEVKEMKRYTICAVEQRSKVLHTTFNAEYRGTLTIDGQDYLDFGLYLDVNPFRRSEGGYGKTWRCWTSRPTDEQREAAKWDG